MALLWALLQAEAVPGCPYLWHREYLARSCPELQCQGQQPGLSEVYQGGQFLIQKHFSVHGLFLYKVIFGAYPQTPLPHSRINPWTPPVPQT